MDATPDSKKVTSDYDLSELDISFDKISKQPEGVIKTETAASSTAAAESETSQKAPEVSKLTEEQQKLKAEREQQIYDAKRKYNYNFFKNFAFSGPDQMELSQKSLEEYILNLENPHDVQSLIISLVNSAYELNGLIPNVELLFYRMFCSPITTKQERAGGKDHENVLVGNIFAQKQVSLTYFGYKSLLETLVLDPKKKHLKKVIAHLSEFEQKDKVDAHLINLIVKIGIEQKYPVLLGKAMKFFMQNDYAIPKKTFQDFILFLERCKGYEEDAKRFIFLTAETETLDFSYELVKPIFIRNMSMKSGNEVLQLFEQIRKNIRLNRGTLAKATKPEERAEQLQAKKRQFYDGLLKDLIQQQAYGLAQIVYSEKMREKFEVNIDDQLTGLQIFASQRKMEEFNELYSKLVQDTPTSPSTTILTQQVSETIARNLMFFDTDKDKQRRLDMTERLLKRTLESSIILSGRMFESLVFVFTESQQWRQLIELLERVSANNCQPEVKTLNYLKKNLLYCFEPQTRGQLKEQIEILEDTFFLPSAQAQSQQAQQ